MLVDHGHFEFVEPLCGRFQGDIQLWQIVAGPGRVDGDLFVREVKQLVSLKHFVAWVPVCGRRRRIRRFMLVDGMGGGWGVGCYEVGRGMHVLGLRWHLRGDFVCADDEDRPLT
jgi:hypothetical protein